MLKSLHKNSKTHWSCIVITPTIQNSFKLLTSITHNSPKKIFFSLVKQNNEFSSAGKYIDTFLCCINVEVTFGRIHHVKWHDVTKWDNHGVIYHHPTQHSATIYRSTSQSWPWNFSKFFKWEDWQIQWTAFERKGDMLGTEELTVGLNAL